MLTRKKPSLNEDFITVISMVDTAFVCCLFACLLLVCSFFFQFLATKPKSFVYFSRKKIAGSNGESVELVSKLTKYRSKNVGNNCKHHM